MKKQIQKLNLKTDQIVILSKAQAQLIAGGMPIKISVNGNCTAGPSYPRPL